ncbi:MAG TPA: oligosaccharide flippase family protein [Nitrospiraceae bacterium]|nr:oligosaccharide flippase family protein [Nitrospiraceae bacterium]
MLTQQTGQFKTRHPENGGRIGIGADSMLLQGTVWTFLADALMIPTGLLTIAFLARRFGPAAYGLFALAASLVAWIEWGLTSLFTRVTIHLTADTRDWEPVAGRLLRWHLAAGVLAMLLLWLLAGPIATLLSEPMLATYLALFALDIPLFILAHGHRNVLTGIGQFRSRAIAGAGRWLSRLFLIVILVELGLSIPGAIMGNIGASVVELLVCRSYIRPSLLTSSGLSIPLPRSALWLVLSAASFSCYTKLDLFALKMLGGSTVQAGFYAAAQNLSILPGIFAHAFSSLLLASLNRSLSDGQMDRTKAMAADAMRLAIGLLPMAGLFAGAAAGITEFCFGAAFRPAAPLLAILIFGAMAHVLIGVAMTILTAAGRPAWTFMLTGPLVPLAVAGYVFLIPRFGLSGPAIVTASLGWLVALASLAAIWYAWGIRLPAGTVVRSLLLCGLAYVLAGAAPDSGIGLVAALAALGVALLVVLWLLEGTRDGGVHGLRRLVSSETR